LQPASNGGNVRLPTAQCFWLMALEDSGAIGHYEQSAHPGSFAPPVGLLMDVATALSSFTVVIANARGNLVPLARKRAKLDFDSYGAGTVDLGTALLATRTVGEAEVDLLVREAEVARDAICISMTYARDWPSPTRQTQHIILHSGVLESWLRQ
jgi:hypothetical protein